MSLIGLNETTRQILLAFTAAAIAASLPKLAVGYETDQLTNRGDPIADSTEVLNREVNRTITEIVDDWRKGYDEMGFVNQIYRRIGGMHWVDRIEKWAMKSSEVDKLDTPRYDSVFAGQPFWAVRVTALFGVGKTIRVNNQLIGTDKLGHFISQGRRYYRRFIRYGSEEKAAEQAVFTERAIFGQLANGVYSNADLVANYEGHRFYRSLFEDNIIEGKPAVLRWENDGWVIQREFDWADHVNEYWDEALNVNYFDAGLYKHMHERLISYCPQYWKEPSLYTIVNEQRLKERYAILGLHDNSELRLDSLCPVQVFLETGAIPEEKSSLGAQASP
jgi:hypothetical protein